MAGKTRSRAWNFTIDDYTGVPASLPAGTRRLIVGEEVAPDGTARLRGYVVFDNPKMSPHKHFLEYGRGTFSAAGGDRDENIERCKRGGNYREFGGPEKRGGEARTGTSGSGAGSWRGVESSKRFHRKRGSNTSRPG